MRGGAGRASAQADRSRVEGETDEGRPGTLRGTVGAGRVAKRPLPKVSKLFKLIRGGRSDTKRHARDDSDRVPLLQDEERPSSPESRSADGGAPSTASEYRREAPEPALDTSARDTTPSSYFKYTSFRDADRRPRPTLHRSDRDGVGGDATKDAVNSTGRRFVEGSRPAPPPDTDGASSRPRHSQCVVALDCEMVGVENTNDSSTGKKKRKAIESSALGRCSIVNYNGAVLFDAYVRPEGKIRSYRTRWSGIRPSHMKLAIPHREAVRRIKSLLEGCTVVGHALANDFAVIDQLRHPREMVRDTANFVPLRRAAGLSPRSQPNLKRLCKLLLGRDIQVGSHSSLEDARASLALYHRFEDVWEDELQRRGREQDRSSWLGDSYWPEDISNAKTA